MFKWTPLSFLLLAFLILPPLSVAREKFCIVPRERSRPQGGQFHRGPLRTPTNKRSSQPWAHLRGGPFHAIPLRVYMSADLKIGGCHSNPHVDTALKRKTHTHAHTHTRAVNAFSKDAYVQVHTNKTKHSIEATLYLERHDCRLRVCREQ